MSRVRIVFLALSLGSLTAAARADDDGWATPTSRASTTTAAAQIGRPVPVPAVAAPAALLDRPRGLGDGATAADPQVQPAMFAPLFRGQAPDAKPLPTGHNLAADPVPDQRNYQRLSPAPVAPTSLVAPEPGAAPADCDDCWLPRRIWSWLHHDACHGCDKGPNACCERGGDECCDFNKFYVSGEYLLWWTRGDPLPPLVTAGSVGDLTTAGVSPGALDRPGTVVLFGNSDANDRTRSGGRFMAGWWFGCDHCLGVEGGGFFLGKQTDRFTATSFGTPILARPFFNVLLNQQDAEFVAEPGNAAMNGVAARPPLAGTITGTASSSFWGAEADLRSRLCCGPCYYVDVFGGYRYLGLDDTLTVSESLQAFETATPFAFVGFDSFKATNRFNGGQIGLDGELRRARWSLGLRTSIALGDVSERVDISGGKSLNGVASAGDLLTQQGTNIGAFHRDRFAWSPQIGLKLGYQVTNHMRAFVGYDFLYVSSVVRAGDQVNLLVNPLPLAGVAGGPAEPSFAFHGSDFWAQGVNFGLEFRY
jgi:hypothetical protein